MSFILTFCCAVLFHVFIPNLKMEPFPLPASLRSRYDYYYTLSSAQPSTATQFYDNQQASLFGDPVPPPSTSSISDSLNSQLYHSFSRHIDEKMALSYQKADLWYNNKNVYKPKPGTASVSGRSESASVSTIENVVGRVPGLPPGPRAKSAIMKRKSAVRRDHSMVSTIDENIHQPSFTRLDYSSEASNSSENATTSNNIYAATTPNTSSSDNVRAHPPAAKHFHPPAKQRKIERPNVNSLTVRPYTESSATSTIQPSRLPIVAARRPESILSRLSESPFVEKETIVSSSETSPEPTSPLPAIIRDKVSIGAPYRVEESRAHKRLAFSILNDLNDPYPELTALRMNEALLRPRSASVSSTTSEPSPRHLTLEGLSDAKYGTYTTTAPSSAMPTRRGHEFTILRSQKFHPPETKRDTSLGKARRSYHGSLPTLWKRAGHDTRVMHERKEKAKRASDSSTMSSLQGKNPTSSQKGMLRVMSSQSRSLAPPSTPMGRSKSAIRFPGMTAGQRMAQRRAKSHSPFPNKKSVNIVEDQKQPQKHRRMLGPFEIVDAEVHDPVPMSGRRVSRAPTNLSPIAGTPNRSGSDGAALSARSRVSAGSKKASGKATARPVAAKSKTAKPKEDPKSAAKIKPKPATTKEKAKAALVKGRKMLSKSSSDEKAPKSGVKPRKPPVPTTRKKEDSKSSAKSHKSAGKSAASSRAKTPPSAKSKASSSKKLPLQKSTSSGSMKKQKSDDSKDEGKPGDRKRLTSATSTASNKSTKSIFSISKLKSFASRKNNSRSKIDEEEGGKSVASKGPVAKALEKKASRKELTKMSSKDSIISNSSGSRTPSKSSKRTISGSSLSLARAPVGEEASAAALAAHSSNVTAAVTEQLAKDAENMDGSMPVTPNIADNVILEKSKKTLESIQRTVSDAADEIQKTIEENLSDLKTLENVLKNPSSAKSARATPAKEDPDIKTTSNRIVSQKSFDNESNNNTNSVNLIDVENNNVMPLADGFQRREDEMSVRSGAMRSVKGEGSESGGQGSMKTEGGNLDSIMPANDGEMPSTSRAGMERTEDVQEQANQGCFGRLCGRCCPCCARKRKADDMQPRLMKPEKPSKWKKLNCFRRQTSGSMEKKKAAMKSASEPQSQKQSKLGLCMRSLVCCKRTNKVQQKVIEKERTLMSRMCPCFGRKDKIGASKAWSTEAGSTASQGNFCSRMCLRLMCCRKKKPVDRKASMVSKKASIGPTVQTEDKPKIDASLVDSSSMMKGAIPILKVPLAWICLFLNFFIPGLGTILSGWLCLCFGIPRFSQTDGFRARLGSWVISHIVGISQAFTIIFCLVGWGWSIWWGMIMLDVAKKHKQLEIEAASIQNVEEGTSASTRTGANAAAPAVVSQNHER